MKFILTAITGLAFALLLSACASSRVYPMLFAQAEAALYESLQLDRDQVRANPGMIRERRISRLIWGG